MNNLKKTKKGPWSTALWNAPTTGMTLQQLNRFTCEIRRISRCLLQACGTAMIVMCSLPNSCVVWCVYSESGGSAAWVLRSRVGHNVNHQPRSLVWFWSRQFATQQMRWIMLIHGGELCKNVCFTVWLVCAHVYSCLDNWALSNRDCGLISPRQAPSVIYKLQSGRPQMWHVNGCFDDWADVGRLLCWL